MRLGVWGDVSGFRRKMTKPTFICSFGRAIIHTFQFFGNFVFGDNIGYLNKNGLQTEIRFLLMKMFSWCVMFQRKRV